MILDIETDGKHTIVEIAYNIYDYIDNNLVLDREVDIIINDNMTLDFYRKIPIELIVNGVTPLDAILQVRQDILLVDYIVCHNVGFDIRFIKKYLEKYDLMIEFPKLFDTMTSTRHLVKSLDKNGRIKNPKLEELYFYLFNTMPDQDLCHRGDYDVKITCSCLNKLLELDIFKV